MNGPTLLACGLSVLLFGTPVFADGLVAARTIRAKTVLSAADVVLAPGPDGTLADPAMAVGLEARVTLYKGQPIRAEDLGHAAIVERNQAVMLSYRNGRLTILAEGRALGRGGTGDSIRVMNTGSRATVTGTIAPDGSVLVQPAN